MKLKDIKIPIYEIAYDSKPEKVYLKTKGESVVKKVPTKKGAEKIIKKIKQILWKKKISYDKSFFRIFDHSRVDHLLMYGSDRANQLDKRKFDKVEWELYPFRLIFDYFHTNKKGEFLAYKNGPLLEDFQASTLKDFHDKGGRIRADVYSGVPDKEVLRYYKKIIAKYRFLERKKDSPYYHFYKKLKSVKKEFPKREKGLQPEFMLSEKLAMKKHRLMRDDVTFAYMPSNGQGMEYILRNAIKKRVPSKIAALAVYRNLVPILPRITKGGFDETGLYGFNKKRINHLVALFLLVPK